MPEYLLVKEASQREDTVRLCILGKFRLWIAGQDLSLPVSRSSKLKNILCYLIFHRERPVSHDELIATFFENENQRDPVSALKMQIMRIRQLLAPYLSPDLQSILGQRAPISGIRKFPAGWMPRHLRRYADKQGRTALRSSSGADCIRRLWRFMTALPTENLARKETWTSSWTACARLHPSGQPFSAALISSASCCLKPIWRTASVIRQKPLAFSGRSAG